MTKDFFLKFIKNPQNSPVRRKQPDWKKAKYMKRHFSKGDMWKETNKQVITKSYTSFVTKEIQTKT